ncbi:fatty acyl-AMP ligase [Mycolicibacterium brisbanense]|uniref:Acyl-CoA synthetase (AMP-forming)/AMP-acid ligase II n=1 Tax=Mycolicibacterium brisbanense TaxID=146020 RepID=A0A100VUH3_9MYCO|nr:fatty acyl-AMP ligase [Mycolicibacterium brisbanense]MCV7157472.1 fatty acyl-AMP ligase [Mycolicibacterium brisbanense]GAS86326.1 acyl-CoA synthetase (AMP-forming)/AMP-acid ligase II [Mycolicibacterium brisbanense]
MKGPDAVVPKHDTLPAALAAAAHTDLSLFFVNAKEQDQQVPKALVHERALSIAADLMKRGVRKGDRVALVLPTCPAFVESFFGVLCAGAVPVPLYPPVRLGKMDEYHRRTTAMLQSVDAALVVTDDRIRRFLGVAVEAAAPRLGCVTAADLGGVDADQVEVAPDDVALIQFSSGTTHDPKPVALTHRNLLSNLASIDSRLAEEGTTTPVGVSWLPLYHDMGLIGNLLSAFYIEASLVLLPPELFVTTPASWLRAISRYRGTYSAAPNFAFNLCVNRIKDEELEGVDLSSWSVCFNGAESVVAAVQRRFGERFSRWGFDPLALTPCYGMAEASLALTFKPSRTAFRTFGVEADTLAYSGRVAPGRKELVSVGRPLAGVEIEIRDDMSRTMEADKVGGIFVKGPSVMAGYFGRPDLTDQALHEGWLDTGDLGFVHDGELYVCGRAKDTVIIRGANHAPQDFEAALDGLPGVRTGCAVAVGFLPEGEEEESLALLVETTSEAPPSLAGDVSKRVWERTGILASHVELLAPGTLPRTSSGKLRRRESARQWQAGALAAPKKVSAMRLMWYAAKGQVSLAKATYTRLSANKRPADRAVGAGGRES